VDVRRGPTAGHGQVLEQQEASAGAVAGRLERHRVGDDPDPLALACGDRVTLVGDGVRWVHGSIIRWLVHQHHFIRYIHQ
jgi:hypothetical protein